VSQAHQTIARFERAIGKWNNCEALNLQIEAYFQCNTPHHKKLNLPTYPHHKHDGSEANVTISSAPMLLDVLQEIAVRVESSL